MPAVLGCGCLTMLTGVGLLLLVVNARSLLEWQLRPLRRAVEAGLPADVGEAERRRFAVAFDALPDALTSGGLDAGTVWGFQRQLAEAAAAGQAGTLDRDTAIELLDALEHLVAAAGGGIEAAPQDTPDGTIEAIGSIGSIGAIGPIVPIGAIGSIGGSFAPTPRSLVAS